jgi:hypothetical protein
MQIYGVLVDFHALREDGGVPAFWDGWYADRDAARAALRIARQLHPGANVCLVMQLDDEAKSNRGER